MKSRSALLRREVAQAEKQLFAFVAAVVRAVPASAFLAGILKPFPPPSPSPELLENAAYPSTEIG